MRELKESIVDVEREYGFALNRLAWSTGQPISGRDHSRKPAKEFLKWLNVVFEEDGEILDELANR